MIKGLSELFKTKGNGNLTKGNLKHISDLFSFWIWGILSLSCGEKIRIYHDLNNERVSKISFGIEVDYCDMVPTRSFELGIDWENRVITTKPHHDK